MRRHFVQRVTIGGKMINWRDAQVKEAKSWQECVGQKVVGSKPIASKGFFLAASL